MAPLLNEEESALDPYKILGLAVGATDQEIKKAYRTKSRDYHPDKNQSAEAPAKFREVEISRAILSDPAKRTYIDTRLETDRKRREQYAQSDKKRKDMIDALEQREEEAKKAKIEAQRRRREEAAEEEIKDAGKRMLAEAQKRAFATAKTAKHVDPTMNTSQTDGVAKENGNDNGNGNGVAQPPITPIDLTLILQFPPLHTLAESSTLQTRLESLYGPINHVFIKDPPVVGEGSKKKKPKGRKAIVEFKEGNWGGCWACWRDLDRTLPSANEAEGIGKGGGGGGWEGVKVKWASGEVPAWVAWSETHRPRPPLFSEPMKNASNGHESNTNTNPSTNAAGNGSLPTFTSAPNFGQSTMSDLLASHNQSRNNAMDKKKREDEFESMTILKMRQMERERLADEIRREEED